MLGIFASCTEDDEPILNNGPIQAPSIQSTQDNNVMRTTFDEVNATVQTIIENTLAETGTTLDACYSVDWDQLNQIITVTFDSTLCLDGRIRDGQMIINYTGPYRTEGSVINTVLNNYSVNGERIEGTQVVTNNGNNSEGNLEFDIEVSNASRTLLDDRMITWESQRTRTWIEGSSTVFNVSDDRYEIVGTANGVNRNGLAFTVEIKTSNPLIIDIECLLNTGLPSGGIITIVPENDFARTVNYGDGECNTDGMFVVTYRELDFPVTVISPLSGL